MYPSQTLSRKLLAGIVALSVVLTACNREAPSVTPVPAPAGSTVSAPPAPSGELRVNLGSEPPTLDPNTSSFAQSITVVHQLFSGMFKFDPDGKVIPDLAKEVPTTDNGGISPGGKVYTFKLKDGLKWSDGQPLT